MAASYGAPGVYVEEKPSGSMPVQGVGTAVAAFVGFTELYRPDAGDPTDPDGVKPQLVTSWPQYERVYGGFAPGIKLPHAVKGFFENGGGICYIVRIPTEGGTAGCRSARCPPPGATRLRRWWWKVATRTPGSTSSSKARRRSRARSRPARSSPSRWSRTAPSRRSTAA